MRQSVEQKMVLLCLWRGSRNMKKIYTGAICCTILAYTLCGCGRPSAPTGDIFCGERTDDKSEVVYGEQYEEKILLTPKHFKSEYDTKEDAFNAIMQEKLQKVLEAEDGIEQADISFLDNETTIMIQLTYADSVIQEDREVSVKHLEEAVQKMFEDREVIVEIKE